MMKIFNCFLTVTLLLCSACICKDKDSKNISQGKLCLESYGKLALHNLKHITAQKNIMEVVINRQKLEKLEKGSRGYREAETKILEALRSLSKDSKAVEHMESMKKHCNPEDSHLLEELNVEEVEAFEKKAEAEEKLSHKPAQPRNLRGGKTNFVRNATAFGALATGVAFSVVPTMLLLPICLVPTAIAFVLSVIGIISILKNEDRKEPNRDTSGDVAAIILIPIVTAGVGLICLAPALIPGGIGYVLAKLIAPEKTEHF